MYNYFTLYGFNVLSVDIKTIITENRSHVISADLNNCGGLLIVLKLGISPKVM